MRLIDLSYPLCNSMPTYPGDDEVKLILSKTIGHDSYTAYSLQTGLHVGTHIDMPMHLLHDSRTVDMFALDCFCGNGVLLDVRGERTITYQQEHNQLINKGDIVLLFTGHDQKFSTPQEYYGAHPVIDESFAHFLISKEIKMIGMDIPSPDQPPFPVHKLFLQHDIFILENVTNLVSLVQLKQFEVVAVPLKIQAEASPVRAYAKI